MIKIHGYVLVERPLIYNTLKQCAEAHGLKTSTLCERLKVANAQDKVWKDGNRYFYLNEEHNRVSTTEKP